MSDYIETHEEDPLEPLLQLIRDSAENSRKLGKKIPNRIINPKNGMKFLEAKTILENSLPEGVKLLSEINHTYGIGVLTVHAKELIAFSDPNAVAKVIERGGILEATSFLNGNIEVEFTFHNLLDDLKEG